MTETRTGVADYFCILGVGDELTWKHRQKLHQESTPTDDSDEQEALQERFDREIVDVAIWVDDDEKDGGSVDVSRADWTVLKQTLPCADPIHAPREEDEQEDWLLLYNRGTAWDANLDWTSGMGAQVLQKQQEEIQKQGGLRNKVKSTWKHFHPFRHKNSTTRRFSLAFRKRKGDERPGIADLELSYVRLHESLLQGAGSTASLPGLAGQLFERYQSQQVKPSSPKEEVNLVNLRDYLALPENFDEWSIPSEFQWIRDPQTASSNFRGTTVVCEQVSTPTSSAAGVEAFENDDVDPTILLPKQMDGSSTAWVDDRQFCYVPIVAIRRQRLGEEERYHEDPAIVDLSVTFLDRRGLPVLPQENDNDDEEEEEEGTFQLLGISKWEPGQLPYQRNSGLEVATKRPHFGSPALLMRRNLPYGFADATFATRVLGRFPFKNYKGLPLPEEELPMFCYPTGCRLYRAKLSEAPVAQYYGFVVKNERGDSIYVFCVYLMEALTPEK